MVTVIFMSLDTVSYHIFWGKGYATESSSAWLKHAFDEMECENVHAMTDIDHTASKNVLKKNWI